MLTFEQYCKQEFFESWKSMSRLMKHAAEDPLVIIMSVERNPLELGYNRAIKNGEDVDLDDPKQIEELKKHGRAINAIQTASFRNYLKNYQSGYIPVKGSYKETITLGDDVMNTEVEENSTIVYCNDDNKKDIERYCRRSAENTRQQAILFIEKGRGKYYNVDTKQYEDIGVFIPGDVEELYTELVGNRSNNNLKGKGLARVVKRFTFTKDKNKITNALKALLKIED